MTADTKQVLTDEQIDEMAGKAFTDYMQDGNDDFDRAFARAIEAAVLSASAAEKKDAEIGRWIVENSSVGGGIADLQARSRPANFIRFPLIEGDTVEHAILSAIAASKSNQQDAQEKGKE